MKVYTTCHRRGFELTTPNVWEVSDEDGHKGYVNMAVMPYTVCDPPEYIQTSATENPNIALPLNSKVLEKRLDIKAESVVYSNSDETKFYKERVAELERQLKLKPNTDVELVDRWRLQFRWYGSWGDIHQEWGFETHKEAENRLKHWIDTFGQKFEDVKIIPYKINKEGL
jgi:hypothetical protein